MAKVYNALCKSVFFFPVVFLDHDPCPVILKKPPTSVSDFYEKFI